MAWTAFEISGALQQYGICMNDLVFDDTESGRHTMFVFEKLLKALPGAGARLEEVNARIRAGDREAQALDREAASLQKKLVESEREVYELSQKVNTTKDAVRVARRSQYQLGQQRESLEKRLSHLQKSSASRTAANKAAPTQQIGSQIDELQGLQRLIGKYAAQLGFNETAHAGKGVVEVLEELFKHLRQLFSTHALLDPEEFEALKEGLEQLRQQEAHLQELVSRMGPNQ